MEVGESPDQKLILLSLKFHLKVYMEPKMLYSKCQEWPHYGQNTRFWVAVIESWGRHTLTWNHMSSNFRQPAAVGPRTRQAALSSETILKSRHRYEGSNLPASASSRKGSRYCQPLPTTKDVVFVFGINTFWVSSP